MSATEFRSAGAAAMELGEVMGLQQGIAGTAPSPREGDLGLLKRAGLTQAAAAAAASHPSPFLDEQKMLRFSKAAQALPSGVYASSATKPSYLSIPPLFHKLHRTKMLGCMFLDGYVLCKS